MERIDLAIVFLAALAAIDYSSGAARRAFAWSALGSGAVLLVSMIVQP